ncbi:MAG: cyclic nucleotide-binding domain-containing protein [Actinobacteria bacterium]|nr:MAG: cyclic nucleotide-binding domain-containing protein [Actinomycetota bacterium]
MTTLAEILGTHPFFFGMRPEHLDIIARCATPADFGTGKTIFTAGDEADACYLLLDGDVALELVAPGQGPHVIETLHSGEIFGWSWLVEPYRWMFDAQALTEVRAIRFDAKCLWAAKEADPQLGFDLLRRFVAVIVDRMQAARMQLMDIYGAPR